MITEDQCKRVMKRFRKRRRERGSSIATLTKLTSTRRRNAGGSEDDPSGIKRRAFAPAVNSDNEHFGVSSFSRTYWSRNVVLQEYSDHWNNHHRHYQHREHRNRLVQWGECLARQKAFGGENKTEMPELVHRKPERIHKCSYYSGCTFLDSDKVLAVDHRGTLDVIQLSELSVQANASNKQGTPLFSHQKIVTGLELGADLQQQRSFSNVHLQAFGSMVAFGLEDDTLCIVDFEEGTNNGRTYYHPCGTNHNEKGPLERVSLSRVYPVGAWRTHSPKRLYYRDRRNPRLPIHDLCNVWLALRQDLRAIRSPRIPSPVRFVPETPPPASARWDILTAHSSSSPVLYVAHIDSDYDAFWTQVLDGRARPKTNVLVDATTRDRPGTTEEHITACALVNELCVATAHLSCGNYGSTRAWEFFDKGLPNAGYSGMFSCIKLWDIRMVPKIRNGGRTPGSPIPSDTISLFQNADVTVAKPSATIPTHLTSGGELTFSEPSFADPGFATEKDGVPSKEDNSLGGAAGSHQVITNLSAARDSNHNGTCGSLVVTTQSRTKPTHFEHSKLDLSGNMRLVRKISQTNFNLGLQPLYAIASSNGTIATVSSKKEGSGGDCPQSVCLYDLNHETNKTTSDRFYQCTPLLHQQCRQDPNWSYKFDANITDRYGIQTDLSCMALNTNGTALLGGSTDGDLFLWRGI